jgi:hypothetical protein
MSLSYYVGRFFQKTQPTPERNEPQTLKMPDPRPLPSKKPGTMHPATVETSRRRAA